MTLSTFFHAWKRGTPTLVKNARSFTRGGWSGWVAVTSVYDGDTFTAYLPREHASFKVRLAGLDTPEKRTRNAEEKAAAKVVREIVVKSFEACRNQVFLRVLEEDKYGRLLGDVFLPSKMELVNLDVRKMERKGWTNLKTFLLSNHLAVAYDGGTKVRFPEGRWNQALRTGEQKV